MISKNKFVLIRREHFLLVPHQRPNVRQSGQVPRGAMKHSDSAIRGFDTIEKARFVLEHMTDHPDKNCSYYLRYPKQYFSAGPPRLDKHDEPEPDPEFEE